MDGWEFLQLNKDKTELVIGTEPPWELHARCHAMCHCPTLSNPNRNTMWGQGDNAVQVVKTLGGMMAIWYKKLSLV